MEQRAWQLPSSGSRGRPCPRRSLIPARCLESFLKKAEEDAAAVREFARNPEIADSIIGFHAQQAVEKWLKAVTAASGVRHSTIHDIDRLIEIVEATGIEVSLDRDSLAVLTQYAVPMRYDELLDAESLGREMLVVLVDEVAAWVEAKLGPSGE